MDDYNAVYYVFSTIPQVLGAFVSIVAVFWAFKVNYLIESIIVIGKEGFDVLVKNRNLIKSDNDLKDLKLASSGGNFRNIEPILKRLLNNEITDKEIFNYITQINNSIRIRLHVMCISRRWLYGSVLLSCFTIISSILILKETWFQCVYFEWFTIVLFAVCFYLTFGIILSVFGLTYWKFLKQIFTR
jgi:hypothetical protein